MIYFSRPIITIIIIFGLFSPMAVADQNDDRLKGLFEKLSTKDLNPMLYKFLENQIWSIWTEAPAEKIQFQMDLGLQSLRLGLYANALAKFTKVTELAPEYAEGWNKQATVLYLLDRHPESITAVNKTLELEPRHFGALSGLGLIYEAYGEEKGARAAYTQALNFNPHMGRIQSRLDYLNSISDESDI